MSKKKNTLKDLDEFLKQQAATLAPPAKLSDQLTEKEEKPKKAPQPETKDDTLEKKILDDLMKLSRKGGDEFRTKLCDLIIRSFDGQDDTSAEDKMLINTALYLKSSDDWKDVIREYWRKKS